MSIMSNASGSRVDNALRAIEAAFQELLSSGATQVKTLARWGAHSDEALHAAQIAASHARRGGK